MTTDIQLSGFDYAALDAETRIVVQQRTTEIRDLTRRTAQDIIDIGRKLNEVKSRLAHGQFGAWLEAEFAWTDRTAQRFMQVAERFGENRHIVEFAPSALYLLAAPSVPDEARDEAVRRAEQGETITHKTARQIVETSTPNWDAIRDLKSRILDLLASEGGLRYDDLRDKTRRADDQPSYSQHKVNLRRALDSNLGCQQIRKEGAVYYLVSSPPTETSQDAASAAEAQNGAAWQTAQTRARLEKALCDVVDGLAVVSQIRDIRSFAEVFSAEEMIATRNLILSALAAFDKTRPHLEDLIAKLDTMIETGKPYDD